jgi:hypothetical protein
MKKCIYTILIFVGVINVFSQSTGNIPLHFKSKFERYWGVGDIWGVQINGTNYGLATLDGGLSIINTNSPTNPVEIAHINHIGYDPTDPDSARLNVPDVETFTYSGTTYAYLATYKKKENPSFPLVMIINLNAAINQGGEILIDPNNPSGSVYVGKVNDFDQIDQSHTLTIAGNYLYVATLNDSLPVWNLLSSPTNPLYKGFVTLNPSDCAIHEMYVKSTGGNQARVYAASLRGGLQVLELTFSEGPPPKGGIPQITVNSRIEQLYDSDRAYSNLIESGDPLFDFRFTHSAWPTNDEQYIFTTDEISLDWTNPLTQYSGNDPNLYSTGTLKTPRREGAFLRLWDASLLGQNNSFKGGYYVAEESPWGITDLTQVDTNWVPNSIHQMFARWGYLYVAHYTQGFRMLDISDPENIIELGYYDDFPSINFSPASDFFFRKGYNWAKGIYGVFPDLNRSNICYAGGADGFYIFDVTPPPYPPTNFTITKSNQDHPYLQWGFTGDENNIDHYNIYKKSNSQGYQYFDQTQNKYYEDVTETINSGGGQGHTVYYYVTAGSVSDYESNASNRVSINVNGLPIEQKIKEEEVVKEHFEYFLSSNYPNPFNPSTQISYSIAQDAEVTIKVFDMLGTEIAELVNQSKSAGSYNLYFNAENLASGVYIYRITASKNGSVLFVNSKQMILLK